MPFFPPNPVPIKERPLLFIDLEMTGLDFKQHEIVEIAALRVSQTNFEIENSFYTKVLPLHLETAAPDALKIINYQEKIWKTEAIPLKQALSELSEFSGGNCVLAGFSVQNEWDFLLMALEKEDLPCFFSSYLIEVWTLIYKKFHHDPLVSRFSLDNICRVLNIPLEQHKPDSDIKATYEIFKKLI